MTGYQSKKAAAQDKMDDDDDTQVYKKPWVDLTEDEIEVIEAVALTKQWAIRMALAAVKEKNL
jgi:hypothetical protein